MVGAWSVSVARRRCELIAPPFRLVLVLCQPFRTGLGLVGQQTPGADFADVVVGLKLTGADHGFAVWGLRDG